MTWLLATASRGPAYAHKYAGERKARTEIMEIGAYGDASISTQLHAYTWVRARAQMYDY